MQVAPNFNYIKQAVQRQFNSLTAHPTFRVALDKDELWRIYLASFPAGTNPMYRNKTEHDCSCCKNFIRAIGDMVAIINGRLVSLWDIHVEGFYQVVVDNMAAYVKSFPIENIFLHTEREIGKDLNYQETDNGVLTWTHFHVSMPNTLYRSGKEIGTYLGEAEATKHVFKRGLDELTIEAFETILELIAQNNLYRGAEFKDSLVSFLNLKRQYEACITEQQKDLFCWKNYKNGATRIRNTAIGQLLIALSNGDELEQAVGIFERMVAPTNYKRPTALITKSMIDSAKKKLDELGLTTALDRRFAVLEDITINNVLYANRSAKLRMNNIFDELTAGLPTKFDPNKKLDECSIEHFLANILPMSQNIEVLLENKHASNMVSLIAPVNKNAKGLFKWHNNFSWSYAGELADSIKERVKSAGGKVDGDLRCSLSWYNFDDLDLHMLEPDGNVIYFRSKVSYKTGGNLDVDMNAGGGQTRTPVENICYPNRKRMLEGKYTLAVENFCKRESHDVGFEIEIEFDGNTTSINFAGALPHKGNVVVATIEYTHKDGFKVMSSIPSTQSVKTIWGITTQNFHKVSVLLLSPNHWDNKVTGNKHYFFMLENCINNTSARGFFNEFLSEELSVHRKVFEVLGSKMKLDLTPNQLSGLGFSSTQRNSVICRVSGQVNGIFKILF